MNKNGMIMITLMIIVSLTGCRTVVQDWENENYVTVINEIKSLYKIKEVIIVKYTPKLTISIEVEEDPYPEDVVQTFNAFQNFFETDGVWEALEVMNDENFDSSFSDVVVSIVNDDLNIYRMNTILYSDTGEFGIDYDDNIQDDFNLAEYYRDK